MEYRQLGRSGLRVSAVGMGGNMFGRDTDAHQTARIIGQALDAGVNWLLVDVIDDGGLRIEARQAELET